MSLERSKAQRGDQADALAQPPPPPAGVLPPGSLCCQDPASTSAQPLDPAGLRVADDAAYA